MDDTGRITRRRTGRLAPFVFTGVQLISPRLLRDPPTDAFSTNVFWDRAIEEGRLYGVSHEGLWFDVGSPPRHSPGRGDYRRWVAPNSPLSRSEEHTSELQSLMRISYAVFCLKKKT